MKFHHIGIFVDCIERGINELNRIYEITSIGDPIFDEIMGVKIIFLKDSSDIRYELVAPFGYDSPVTGVLQRGHNFLNHLAYTTKRFEYELSKLRKQGMVPLGPPQNAKAFDGQRVSFFLTKLNYIIEVIED